MRMNLSDISILLGVARQQIDNIVVGDRGDVQGIDIVLVARIVSIIGLGRWHNCQAILRAGGYDRCCAESSVACIEEHVILGERIFGIAWCLDVGDSRVIDTIVLGMRLVEIVV